MSGVNNPQDGYLNMSVSGQGFLTLPWVYTPFESASASGTQTANVVYGMQINIPFQITVSTFNAWIRTQIAASQAGFGLYNLNGSKVVTGTVSGAALGKASVTVGSVVITPGVYLYCWTASIATLKLSIGGAVDNLLLIMLKAIPSAPYTFTAANPSVAGVLPNTLGVLTSFDLTFNIPFLCVCTP